jgi:NAD-dependent deacetylase
VDALELDSYAHIVFFTGAGLSAESGLPTYRGAGGVWGSYDYETYACQRAFDADPNRVWDFHDERRRRMAAAKPSAAHEIIAGVQHAHPSVAILTQNIDGLQQRAGSEQVIELHGSIWRVRCACHPDPQPDFEAPLGTRRCPACGQWRRPDIVWFEDAMQPGPLERALAALQACDLLISIGTSGVVYPAAQLPELASQRGSRCIEVNPVATPVSAWYDTHIREPASVALRALFPAFAEGADPG